MLSNSQKFTAVTGAAVLTFGLAGPAFANGTAADASAKPTRQTQQHVAPTFAQVQSWIIKRIDKHLARIAKAEARVSASTVLTAQQRTDATARLTAKATALTALKAQVTAATTKAELQAAIKAFVLADGKLFWGDRHGHGFLTGWSDGDRDDQKLVGKAAPKPPVVAKAAKGAKSVKATMTQHAASGADAGRATSTWIGNRAAARTISSGHHYMGHDFGHGGFSGGGWGGSHR